MKDQVFFTLALALFIEHNSQGNFLGGVAPGLGTGPGAHFLQVHYRGGSGGEDGEMGHVPGPGAQHPQHHHHAAGGCCSSGQQLKGNQEDPCKTKSRVVGDEVYCDRYWECVNSQPELYDCPNGLVFAGKHRGVTEGCDYPWRSNYCEGKQLANGPISTDHCDWLYGIFGHETSCTRYWTCWNGTATEQLCIGGLLYNENAHSCDWPENVDGCQKHPLCNEDANGNVPLGKSCNRYWQCQGGYPRLQRCPAMLVFDRHSLRCVVPPTEECDIPTTPLPFDGDLPDNQRGGISKDEQEQQLANEGVPPLPLQGKNFQRARN